MSFLTKLERKIGFISVDHLPIYIVSAQALVFLWSLMNPGDLHLLRLHPAAVLEGGEWWRLLTFLFIVPVRNAIFAFFFLYLLYVYGSALEDAWGSFSFTLFYALGALGTIAAGFLFGGAGGAFFLNLTVFLAFAALFPDFRLYLFFILPVKVKWLAWATWAWLGFMFLVGPLAAKAAIAASLANYLLFFAKHHFDSASEFSRRMRHRARFRDWGE